MLSVLLVSCSFVLSVIRLIGQTLLFSTHENATSKTLSNRSEHARCIPCEHCACTRSFCSWKVLALCRMSLAAKSSGWANLFLELLIQHVVALTTNKLTIEDVICTPRISLQLLVYCTLFATKNGVFIRFTYGFLYRNVRRSSHDN